MNRDMVIEHLAEWYVAEGTHMSKGNGNCFARRGHDSSEPTALLDQFEKMLTPHILDLEPAPSRACGNA